MGTLLQNYTHTVTLTIGTTKIVVPVTLGVNLSSGKTSVDTGSFQPGVYRVNPYDVYKEEIEPGEVTAIGLTRVWGGVYNFVYTGYLIPSAYGGTSTALPTALTTLGDQALQRAYAKLGQADLGMGENLGEIRETLNMLKSPLSSLRKFLRKDAMRNLKELKNLLLFQRTGSYGGLTGVAAAKAAADTWLEIRYGFRPILYLIGDLIERVQKKHYGLFDPNVIRSVRSRILSTEEKLLSSSVNSWPGSGTGYYTEKTEMIAFASVQYRQTVELSDFLHRYGLNPRFWPEIAWELTKLSFVWDWVLTIGPWLQSLRFKPEITVLGNTVGRKVVRTYATQSLMMYTGYGDYPANPFWVYPKGQRKVMSRYQRTVNTSLPLTPIFRVDDRFNLSKVVDLIALSLQRIIR